MDIRGGFNHGDGVIDATRWLNTQERTITVNVQSEITKRIRELTKKLQSDLDDAIAGGPVPFTKRAFFFNFIQNGPTRTNQIIIRGDQAAYLRSVVTDANELFNKIIPTSNAKLTKQGNITGLQKNMNKRYKVIERKGKKMLVDTTMKKKKRNKRIIGIVEEKRRKMVFDFFKEAEAGAKIALSGVNGTYIFTRQITQ